MYIPSHFAAEPDAVRNLLAHPGAANLVTMTDGGLLATLLPFAFNPQVGEHGALQAHMARNNPQWSTAPTGEALAIIQGPDDYVSPSWYASKAEHGRVVPTWNYSTAHVYGELVVHDDAGWLARHVRHLTALHEGGRQDPWAVDDAPGKFVAGQLRAIVGVELVVSRIEAKEKLSQNRSAADAAGVAAGLRSIGREAGAAAVERVRT
ncbi:MULTISPECIES: FMN-binding negative transcriptional regulator [Pseudarthrobacter]|uniref:Transcriptional regulator n=1 Tax=Pseudarthrobacter niigatensis TaxID=369935 RepID=A0AAJ1SW21_9MICC|nr:MULTISPECIES: FMN-binding negative transcriptional regulator [Pseudarthrobacter]MDQ0146809.1 transcriptional regulator [Pseudarthrobacter niigatensis]MDQ0264645.1 transcriptional regulator [Pseudarthrobacter niigatensis]QDG87564.1 FMN-binding negative transcriptional regulator [Pseudarthrobacter sp. NIBRBAC000502770]